MKVLYVCNEYPPEPHGGIGTFVGALAPAMADAGHEVTVIGWGKGPRERMDKGVQVLTLPERRVRGVSWFLNRRALAGLADRVARGSGLDVIETVDFQGPLLGKVPGVPTVARLHLSQTAIHRHAGVPVRALTRYCERKALASCEGWIGVSRFAVRLTEETFHLKAPAAHTVIFNPMPPPSENPGAALPDVPRDFVLFAGGAVSERKGALAVALAAKSFLVSNPRLQLVFAGPPDPHAAEPVQGKILGILGDLGPRARFLGRIERRSLLDLMGRAKAFLYPSTLETFGIILAEAMSQGCPVVACDMEPCSEFIQDGKTGFLVPPGDPGALAQRVNTLLRDRALRERVGRAGKAYVAKELTVPHCVRSTVDFYRELLSGRKAGR